MYQALVQVLKINHWIKQEICSFIFFILVKKIKMFYCFWQVTLGRRSIKSMQICSDSFFQRPEVWPTILPFANSSRLFLSPSLLFLYWQIIMKVKLPLVFLQLGQWSTFGTLDITAQIESEAKEYAVVTEEDCEILKIPAKNYAKLKSVWPYLIHILTQYGYKLKC